MGCGGYPTGPDISRPVGCPLHILTTEMLDSSRDQPCVCSSLSGLFTLWREKVSPVMYLIGRKYLIFIDRSVSECDIYAHFNADLCDG